MRITKVVVHYARKLGDPRPGKFGSLDNGISLEAELSPEDSPLEAIEELHQMAKAQVKEYSVAWMKQVTRDMSEIFEHLPLDVQTTVLKQIQEGTQS